MAKINLNDAFLTTKVKNDTEIERATNKNVNRISNTDIQEIHQNLMRVLNIKSESESKYFAFENFKSSFSHLAVLSAIQTQKLFMLESLVKSPFAYFIFCNPAATCFPMPSPA